MNNQGIDYKSLLYTIEAQFSAVKADNEHPEFAGINFVVADEQMFTRLVDKRPDTVYIVAKFGRASINYNQATLPITLQVIGVQNEVRLIQSFLSVYVTTYNLLTDDTTGVTQLYMTPSTMINFNEIYNGFRTLFSVSGTFVIGDNLIRLSNLTYYWPNPNYDPTDPESLEYLSEEIQVISFNDNTTNNLNPQPFYDMHGRAKSYVGFQVYSFSIVLYLTIGPAISCGNNETYKASEK